MKPKIQPLIVTLMTKRGANALVSRFKSGGSVRNLAMQYGLSAAGVEAIIRRYWRQA